MSPLTWSFTFKLTIRRYCYNPFLNFIDIVLLTDTLQSMLRVLERLDFVNGLHLIHHKPIVKANILRWKLFLCRFNTIILIFRNVITSQSDHEKIVSYLYRKMLQESGLHCGTVEQYSKYWLHDMFTLLVVLSNHLVVFIAAREREEERQIIAWVFTNSPETRSR